jgi:hypothetical protein
MTIKKRATATTRTAGSFCKLRTGSSTPSLRCNDVAQDDSFKLLATRVVTNLIAAAILLRGLGAATAYRD